MKWGTSNPVMMRDQDFGIVRLRAFGNYAFRVADPKLFHTEISGTREAYTVAGHYFDTYRKVEGRWRFAERDFRTYHWVPLSKGWA
mgnify:CR=1 FL=1